MRGSKTWEESDGGGGKRVTSGRRSSTCGGPEVGKHLVDLRD